MKEKFYLILIVILIAGLAVTGFFGYVGPAIYAKDKAEESQEMLEISESQEEIRDFREEAEKKYKEEAEKNIKTLKRVHKAIAERTSECKQTLDSMIFTLQSLAKQARENGQIEKEKELLLVLIDYNSVKGDLDAIAVLLKMAEFVEDEEFIRYFELISQGYEYFKDDFNLKNELFLERISQLKDKDTLRFEKKLYGVFCKYFEYDLWQDRQAWTEPEDESQKGKGEGEAE
jgi:septal ring factor EnvC (AmiA/AmiB activator)